LLNSSNQPIKLSPKATFIFPNYQDYGYGIFLLDEKSRDYVLKNIQNEKDDFLRSMMWGTLWDSVRETELNPKDYVELAIKNVSSEKDELTIQTILSRVSTAMNYYLSDAQAKELAPELERVLLEKMTRAETLGQRVTFYRAFLNVASTEEAKQTLKDLLSLKFQIQGLTLKTKDKFDIVSKLLILGDKDAPQQLENLAKTESGDDAKRYAYAAGAGIGTAQNKEKFYNDFIGDRTISESWIEAAFAPFNSTRHSDLTLPYLEKALTELPNHKRNRKIFFVNAWLAAFVAGQKNEKALQIVQKFLDDEKNLDRDLRLKILEVSDGLERAVKIRAKFAK
jgi:aminopeptidase N